jgi:CheY-like chemotaxis protein
LLVDAALAPQGGVVEMAETRNAECVLLLACHEAHALEPAANGYRGALYRPVFPDDLRACLDTPPPPLQVVADGAHPLPQDKMAGLRVLVAEDNATNQFALTRMLEGMGATVVSALNGREALAQVEAHAFDVILMDVMMPEMDGLAATRAIRASFGPDASIPIIALTASAFVEDREAAYAAGVSAFLTKPITSQMLLDIIEACRAGVPDQTMSDETMSGQVMPVQALPTKDDDAGPALDRPLIEQLREDLGPEHMRTALDLFLSDLAKRGASLRLCDRSATTLRKEAHALKGSAASFGFRHIAQAAARLEDAARENEVEKFDILVARLLEAAARAPILLAA